ncbi:unnamed protein product [Rotaria magnacalcarata]|uniref:Uncharacterized protein n=1 Tax=Rotaria magnacalcarata TaxID=392030 RepID=A0A820LPZ5_9BILA|nr:unnamed protein product [Rotaria magnacalcarata]
MNNDSNKNFEQSNSIAADRAQGSFDEDLVTWGFYIIFPSFNLILFSNCQVQHRITITIRIEAPDHEPL